MRQELHREGASTSARRGAPSATGAGDELHLIGSVWGLLVVGALLASSAMALMWLIQVRIRDASHVDVAWAVLIACCAIALRTPRRRRRRAPRPRRGAGLDLGLPARRLPPRQPCTRQGGGRPLPGAPRGVGRRTRTGTSSSSSRRRRCSSSSSRCRSRSSRSRPTSGFGALAWIGIAVWAIGNVGTILSDYQLAQWRSEPGEQGKDRARRPVGLVAPPELLLRVGELVRDRARRERRSVGLDRVARAGRSALPPVQGHGHPGDRGAGAALARGLRRVPADDERLRPASAAPGLGGRDLEAELLACSAGRASGSRA